PPGPASRPRVERVLREVLASLQVPPGRILLRCPLPGLARERILVDQGQAPRPRLRPDDPDRHDALPHEVAGRRYAAIRSRADRDRETRLGGALCHRALRRAPEPHSLHAPMPLPAPCPLATDPAPYPPSP